MLKSRLQYAFMTHPLQLPNFLSILLYHFSHIHKLLSQSSLLIAPAFSTSPDLLYSKTQEKNYTLESVLLSLCGKQKHVILCIRGRKSPHCQLFDHFYLSRLDNGKALGGKHFLNKQDIYWSYLHTYYHLPIVHLHSSQITNHFSASWLASWLLHQTPSEYTVEGCFTSEIGI